MNDERMIMNRAAPKKPNANTPLHMVALIVCSAATYRPSDSRARSARDRTGVGVEETAFQTHRKHRVGLVVGDHQVRRLLGSLSEP